MVNSKRVHELREENKELLNFTYDSSAYKTRDIKTLFKDKKGICYDFVNYLYHKSYYKSFPKQFHPLHL